MGFLKKKNKGLNELYTDKFSIYRNITVDDGFGGTIEKESLILENIPCRISKKSLFSTGGDNLNVSVQEFTLFFNIDVEVLQNDRLEILRGDIKYNARASQPFKYLDILPHQECILKEVIENGN